MASPMLLSVLPLANIRNFLSLHGDASARWPTASDAFTVSAATSYLRVPRCPCTRSRRDSVATRGLAAQREGSPRADARQVRFAELDEPHLVAVAIEPVDAQVAAAAA